jgi:hypothetical protein
MLHYEEKKCVCTNNARKVNDQKRLLQKNSLEQSLEQSLEKCLQEEDSKLKQNKLKTKFFTFFRIILLLFHISFYFFLVYYSIIFLNIFNFL